MRTFTGEYLNGNFVYSDDTESVKLQLISILNTPLGSRFYYPGYGSRINEYRFSILNFFTINIIGQEVKNAIKLIDGVTLKSLSYNVVDDSLVFNIELQRLSNDLRISLSVKDGVAS